MRATRLVLLILAALVAHVNAQQLGCVMTYAEGQQAPKPCPGCMPSAPDPNNPLVACNQFLDEWDGLVCCQPGQTAQLLSSMPQLESSFVSCGACILNFWRLFCEYTCSPYQASFMRVENTKVNNNMTLVNTTLINFDLETAIGHYNSCKNIPFGGGEVAYRLWGTPSIFFNFVGSEGGIATPSSPPTLSFVLVNDTEEPSDNITSTLSYSVVPCNTICGCQTCEAACQAPPHFDAHLQVHRCRFSLGHHEFDCLAVGLAAGATFGGFLLAVLTGLILVRVLLFSVVVATFITSLAVLASAGLFAAYLASSASPIVIYVAWGVVGLSILLASTLALVVRLRTHNHARATVAVRNINGSDGSLWQGEGSFVRRYWMAHGRFVATHPIPVLIACVVIVAVCASGLAFLDVEQNPEKLWVSSDSRAAQDKAYFDKSFGPFYRIEQLIITLKPNASGAPYIMQPLYLALALDIQTAIRNLVATTADNASVTLDQLCYEPVPGRSCIIESPLQWFASKSSYLELFASTQAALTTHITLCTNNPLYYTCLSDIATPTDANVVLGGYKDQEYMNATALVFTFLVNNAPPQFNDSERAEYLANATAWEALFLKTVEAFKHNTTFANLSIAYSAERSVQDELARESGADIRIIAISYVLMFIYVAVALGGVRLDLYFFLYSKVMLAFAGIILVILSVLASAGINSYIGVKATLIISEVIPFLVLAIGVDNIFIIVAAFDTTPLDETIPDRIGATLAEVGSGVVVAGLSEAVAFLLGAFTRMPAVQAFAFYAALAIFFDFIFHLTAFVALLALDARRIVRRRVDCLPCVKLGEEDHPKEAKQPLIPPTQRHRRQQVGIIRSVVERVAPFILHPVVKLTLVAAFVFAALCSVYLATHLQVGLDQRVALPHDSYLIDYFNQEANLLMVGPPLYLVIREPFNYTSIDMQNELCFSQSGCKGSSLVNFYDAVPYTSAPVYSWLDDYLSWAQSPIACCFNNSNPCFSNSSARPTPEEFVTNLPSFLTFQPPPAVTYCQIPGYVYVDDVVFNTNENGGTSIGPTRFRTYHSVLRTQSDYINALRVAYEVSEVIGLPVFPYSVFYIYFEQYLYIVRVAIMNVGLAIAGVFIVSLFLLSDPWLAFLIVITVAMAEADLLGVMHYWNISVNAVSVTNLVMAIGIFIEFCVHIASRFAAVEGSRSERAHAALVEMGSSVLSGITLTKFIGVVVLAFSTSDIFRVYYFRMYLSIVLIGAAHGLIFLPILLSLLGTNAVRKGIQSAFGCGGDS